MTRRLVAAFIAAVMGTLVIVGSATAAIARLQARAATEEVLRNQAESLLNAVVSMGTTSLPAERLATRRVLRDLRRALRVEDVEFVRLDPDGRLTGTLPDGVTAEDLDPAALAGGETVAGAHGQLVYVAAPSVGPQATVVAVVTQEASASVGVFLPWFLAAAVVTLALGASIAVFVARRLARPVDDAARAAVKIADGELSTRLPEPAAGAGDELARLTRSLNAMAGGLERARTLDQQFLLSISHDLRTPLTSIRGYADAIADGTATDAAAAARVIVGEAGRLERLVADVLDLAHLDGRSFSLRPRDHDLRVIAVEAVRAFTPTSTAAGLDVVVVDGDAVIVHADPARVRQVLGNLLENAAKHARARIEVRAAVAEADGAATARVGVLQVDDDGPGIAPEDRPHVFERLYVSRHRPARAEVGSGLGLAIVRHLAEAMGGSATVASSPSGGARIAVTFPLGGGD